MIMNVDGESNQERFKPQKGIGLYKITYEMDVVGKEQQGSYAAGIIAYNEEEAVKTLTNFCSKKVKGFKGMKINEMGFEGLCHEMSDKVKNAVINSAVREGKVVEADVYNTLLSELEDSNKKTAKPKKSIVPKEKK